MDKYPGGGPVAAPFDLSGGHPALDLVNTLDNRFAEAGALERLAGYDDLLRFAEQSHLMNAAQARLLARSASPGSAARVLRAVRELREALAATLYGGLTGHAPDSADLSTLEKHFHGALAHRELHWGSDPRVNAEPVITWQWGRFVREAEWPVWMLAHAAAELMLSPARGQVRACGAETCRWLFLDTSKNHTRRWCNMKVCGNRMKARRYQARHAD